MIRFANNVSTKLFSSVLTTDTQLVLENRAGESLPTLVADDDFFMLTLQDEDGNLEIVKCIHVVGDVCTVVRAQEGTVARAFTQGAIVEQRLTAGSLNSIVDGLTASVNTLTPLVVPTGMIAIWSGAAFAIPTGWHICDGTFGTINLVDRFVLGSSGDQSKGGTNAGTALGTTAVTIAASTDVFTPNTNYMPYHNHGAYSGWSGACCDAMRNETGKSIISNDSITYSGGGWGHSHTLSQTSHAHTVNSVYPLYYKLAFIQKL